MPKVLITGITGFTGSHLAKFLLDHGEEVYGLDIPGGEPADKDYLKEISDIHYADIREQIAVSKIIHTIKPDYIFHLAGLIACEDLKTLLEVNVLGTKNVLEAISSYNVKILIPGSAAEYGTVPKNKLPITENTPLHPIDTYGISKVAQTQLGYQFYKKHGYEIFIARPFNIIGPGEPQSLVCSTIAKQIANIQKKHLEPILYVGNIETERDFIDVRDVVKAYWAIVNNGIPGEIYNVCSGKAFSIKKIISLFLEISGVNFDVKQDPKRIKVTDIPTHMGENKKIRKQTGWHPEISLEETLKDLLEYYSSNI